MSNSVEAFYHLLKTLCAEERKAETHFEKVSEIVKELVTGVFLLRDEDNQKCKYSLMVNTFEFTFETDGLLGIKFHCSATAPEVLSFPVTLYYSVPKESFELYNVFGYKANYRLSTKKPIPENVNALEVFVAKKKASPVATLQPSALGGAALVDLNPLIEKEFLSLYTRQAVVRLMTLSYEAAKKEATIVDGNVVFPEDFNASTFLNIQTKSENLE